MLGVAGAAVALAQCNGIVAARQFGRRTLEKIYSSFQRLACEGLFCLSRGEDHLRAQYMRPQTADLLNEALVLHRRGALAEAAARYSEVLRAEPDNADAHYYLGMMRCQEGRFAEGAELARKALASNPRHARAHVLLGRACNGLGRNDEALTSLEQAIALAPDLAQAHSHLADILSDLGRNAEAIDSYRRALVLAPDAV